VVDELKVTLLGSAPKVRATDPKAYALHLQAIQLGRQGTAASLAKSDELYRQVLSIDPRYAPAWNGLADNYFHEVSIGSLPNQAGLARAREAATKALEIDPDYAAAHSELGLSTMFGGGELALAAKHFERALALDPTDLDVLRNAAVLLSDELGRVDQALVVDAVIVRRDPVNVNALFKQGIDQRMAGRYDDAMASIHTVLNLSPGRGEAHLMLGFVLLRKGDASGALAEIEQETSEVWRMIGLPMAYHALGRKAESDQALAALIGKYEKDAPYNIAYVYAFRAEADKAFEWLDKAIKYEDPGLTQIVGEEGAFDNIRSDARWLPFLRKIGKAPEQLAKIEFKLTLPKEWQAEATTVSGSAP
jgi:tetratricopeptide (TPR) repeat protein